MGEKLEEGTVPILVLGSGQRCGSTLIQRLLSSHPDVMIWGEHGGHLRQILEASRTIRQWDEGVSQRAREDFEARGHQSWMATLLPEPAVVGDAARAYMRTLFAAPAAARGRSRWGFKEVRFGLEEAEAVRELFASTRVLHVTRDPRDVLRSLEVWERTGTEWQPAWTANTMADWTRINRSFLDAGRDLDWVRSWRYEDIVASPDEFVDGLSRLLDLDPAALDRRVFDVRVSTYGTQGEAPRAWEELPGRLRALIDAPLREVAAAYGYAVPAER
jgi:sulfotransferase family protein